MDKDAALASIKEFREALEALGVGVSRLILYGSYGKGNWREDSDIDLVVVSPDFEGKSHWERSEMLGRAVYEVWQPIEAVAMTPEEWREGKSTIVEFAQEGELVYFADETETD